MGSLSLLVSAILTAVSYQSFGLGILISLIPMLQYANRLTYKHFWLWGLIYMGILHAFFIELHTSSSIPIAISLWAIVTIYTSLFYCLAGIISQKLHQYTTIPQIIHIPLAFAVCESLKVTGPFANPLGNLGYSLSFYAEYLPSYSIIGTSGIGIMIIWLNILFFQIIKKIHVNKSIIGIIIITILLLFLGFPIKQKSFNKLSVSVIQTSIQQDQKRNRKEWRHIRKNYKQLIKAANGQLVILPESIFPTTIYPSAFYQSVKNTAKRKDQAILFGSFIKKSNHLYNGTILVSSDKTPQFYYKEKLMPFGEYLPIRSLLNPFIPPHLQFNDFNRGSNNSLTFINDIKVSQRICLEGIYSNMIHTGGDVMVIVANNAWFNNSSSGKKLIQFIKAHAAEIRRPFLVSSNFGQSAIINYLGGFEEYFNHSNEGLLESVIHISKQNTIFSLIPNGATYLFIAGYLIWLRKISIYRRYNNGK